MNMHYLSGIFSSPSPNCLLTKEEDLWIDHRPPAPFRSGLKRHYWSILEGNLAEIATNYGSIDTFSSLFLFSSNAVFVRAC